VTYLLYPRSIARSLTSIVVMGVLVLSLACRPEDYQKPIQGFQEASNTVIAADRAFLSNENTIEQNKYIDQQVFERKPLGPAEIDNQIIITPAEIKLRTEALDALSKYTANLATLAQGKADPSTGQNMKTASTNLQTSATNAGSQSSTNTTQAAFSTKFSGVAGAAAAAIGAVAQLIMDHKTRNEIEKSVKDTNDAITALITLIGDDAQGSYLRQKNQLGAYGMQLSNDYKCEIAIDSDSAQGANEVKCPRKPKGVEPDPIVLLMLADKIKASRAQEATLDNANPAPAIAQMQKAHQALVAYVTSDKSPKSLSDLATDVKDFVTAAQPLGQAVQGLVTAIK
jgi:hypothetical protein